MSKAEAEAVSQLMESVLNGERTCREVSDLMEINLGVIERVACRMTEQRLGIPASPADPGDLIEWGARMMLVRCMGRPWD
jgi:hypothetical protein